MGFFDISFNLFGFRITPPNKRKEKHSAWIRVLLSPMQRIGDEFLNVFFELEKEKALRNGQKIILEDTLNKLFNLGNPTLITIDSFADDIAINYLYNEAEGFVPLFMYNESEPDGPAYFFNESESIASFGFKVLVPAVVFTTFTEGDIKAEVDKYRTAGTIYTVETI